MSKKIKKRVYRTYSDEFKADAVRLVLQEGLSAAGVAKDLGINPNTLHNWVNLKRTQNIHEGVGPEEIEDKDSELARLRRENRILREEREILKKAAAFFAKESK